jgi:hypothetical protein
VSTNIGKTVGVGVQFSKRLIVGYEVSKFELLSLDFSGFNYDFVQKVMLTRATMVIDDLRVLD